MNNSYLVEKIEKYYRAEWWVVTMMEKYPDVKMDQVHILSQLSKLHLFLKSYFDSIFESGQVVLIGNRTCSNIDSMSLRINTQEPFYFRIIDSDKQTMKEIEMRVSKCDGLL